MHKPLQKVLSSDPRSWLNFKLFFLFPLAMISWLDFWRDYCFLLSTWRAWQNTQIWCVLRPPSVWDHWKGAGGSTCCTQSEASVAILLPNLVCVKFLPYLCEHIRWDAEYSTYLPKGASLSLWCVQLFIWVELELQWL